MNLRDFLAGLEILKRYVNKGEDSHPLDASHDVFSFSTDKPMSEEDNAKMRVLGWWRDEDGSEDGETVPTPEDEYGSTWSAFT